jgi:hypothetical protein
MYRGPGFQPTVPKAAGGQFSFVNPMAPRETPRKAYGTLPPLARPSRVPVAEVQPSVLPTTAATAAAAEAALVPSVWQSALNTTTGQTYYYKGGETRWNNPDVPTLEPVAAPVASLVAAPVAAPVATPLATLVATPVENALPAGWRPITSSNGRTYYYHNSGKKTWKKPVLPSGWQSTANSEGRTYYYKGSQTSWDWPEEEAAAAAAAVTASKTAAAVATVAESANGSTKKELKKEMKNLGLPTEGTKKELVATVRAAVAPAAEQAAATVSALAGGGSSSSVNTTDEQKLAQLRSLLGQYEIRPDFLQRTLQLDEFEIALILDNSSSMWEPSDAPMPSTFNLPSYASELRLGYIWGDSTSESMAKPDLSNKQLFWSRWEELKHIAKIIIPIANVFDKSGVDLYFFARDPINNYTDASNFDALAGKPDSPTGTPLTETLHQVLADKAEMPAGKKLLIFIITDGEPNGGVYRFKNELLGKRENVYVSILACNGDQGAIGYLNDIDETVPRVDCVDDYTSEKQEVLGVQGSEFPFSYGDYIIKALLGAVDPAFDNLDEKNLLTDTYVIKPSDHYSVAKGKNSMTLIRSVSGRFTVGTTVTIQSPIYSRRGQPPSYVTDTVTVTSISRDRKKITFTPPLAHTHHNYQTDCLPGSTGCLPFWPFQGGTRRRLPKSKTRKNKNRKTRHKSRR